VTFSLAAARWAIIAGLLCGMPLAMAEETAALTLNDPLVPGGQVCSFLLAPDGRAVVYRADQDTDQMTELYSVPPEGGTVTKLSAPLPAGSRVAGLTGLTPDGRHVLYVVSHRNARERELYSVEVAGGPVTKLNGPLMENDQVWDFRITPDSTRVVYAVLNVSATAPSTAAGLYSVAVAGGPVTRLTPARTGNSTIWEFEIAPDGGHVVYRAVSDIFARVAELHSVPTGGGTVTRLNAPLVAGGNVHRFRITADGRRVLYVADQDTDDVPELYSVAIEGGPVTRLAGPVVSDPLINGGDGRWFQISPDGGRVVYLADDQPAPAPPRRYPPRTLFGVAVTGGPVTRLSVPLGEEEAIFGFRITPDGSRVVYVVVSPVGDGYPYRRSFHSVPVEGGPVLALTGLMGANESIGFGNFQISPDGSRVVYRANNRSGHQLYSVPTAGGPPRRLNAPLSPASDGSNRRSFVHHFRISADSGRVVYAVATGTTFGSGRLHTLYDLHSVAAAGGPVTKLAEGLRADFRDRPLQIAPDDRRVVYRAAEDPTGPLELHEVALPPAVELPPGTGHDFDGDGKADILWRHTSGQVHIWLMHGATIRSHGSAGGAGPDWSLEGVADFDGDGKADILWRHSTGLLTLWLMDGLAIGSRRSPGSVMSDWSIERVADVDGDRRADILWRHVSGQTYVWLMDGARVTGHGSLGSVPTGWSIHGDGDLDGDGRADLVWRHASGPVYIWLMDGTTVSRHGFPHGFPFGVPAAWSIQGVGDLDDDGRADILWQDSHGALHAWYMDGTRIAFETSPGTLAGWSVEGVRDLDGDGRADLVWRHPSGVVAASRVTEPDLDAVATLQDVADVAGDWTIQ
jgi:Tol biopolymer transport system component